MPVSATELSRALSHALRHEPWRYELELDEDGWVPIEQILDALRAQGVDWAGVDRSAIESMIATSQKKRHELLGDKIRALYGHSTPQRITYAPADPPTLLFHGTAPDTRTRIQADGLLPMSRQYVHLAVDRETARLVGQRKSGRPSILTVRALDAARAGVSFYQASDLIWLADHIPSEYIFGTALPE